MIEIRELVKTFDGFAALDGASLTVPQGAIYGLVGPNGAGKSTLLRHLTGVYRQDSGTVSVDGADVWENVAVKQRIASIPDDWHYFMQSSIRDMMKFYRGFYPQFNMERYEKLRGVFSLDEKQLIRRLRGIAAHVNLIPLNDVAESPLKPSLPETVLRFQKTLEASGIPATVRRTLGSDINASCGQLRRNYEAEKPKEGSGMDGSMGTDGHGKRA